MHYKSYKMRFNLNHPYTKSGGFTLVEVLLSVILLGLLITSISALYISGLQSLNAHDDRMLLDSHLRSRMEVLIGTNFSALSNGSEVVNVNGQNFTINWNVASIDLDGDSNPEANAMQVTVTVAGAAGHSLATIIVDNEDRLGKI